MEFIENVLKSHNLEAFRRLQPDLERLLESGQYWPLSIALKTDNPFATPWLLSLIERRLPAEGERLLFKVLNTTELIPDRMGALLLRTFKGLLVSPKNLYLVWRLSKTLFQSALARHASEVELGAMVVQFHFGPPIRRSHLRFFLDLDRYAPLYMMEEGLKRILLGQIIITCSAERGLVWGLLCLLTGIPFSYNGVVVVVQPALESGQLLNSALPWIADSLAQHVVDSFEVYADIFTFAAQLGLKSSLLELYLRFVLPTVQPSYMSKHRSCLPTPENLAAETKVPASLVAQLVRTFGDPELELQLIEVAQQLRTEELEELVGSLTAESRPYL